MSLCVCVYVCLGFVGGGTMYVHVCTCVCFLEELWHIAGNLETVHATFMRQVALYQRIGNAPILNKSKQSCH